MNNKLKIVSDGTSNGTTISIGEAKLNLVYKLEFSLSSSYNNCSEVILTVLLPQIELHPEQFKILVTHGGCKNKKEIIAILKKIIKELNKELKSEDNGVEL